MKKPNYKKANEELMKLLALEPEPKRTSSKNTIIDVTKESSEIAYQFTEYDITIIKSKEPLSFDMEEKEDES